MDGGKATVARADAVTALALQVIEKGKHHLSIQLLDTKLTGTFRCISLGIIRMSF